jgi:osmotically-inducible protein OsmY
MLRRLFFAMAAGAALMYFFDPNNGRRRRNIARDRGMATVRRGLYQVSQTSRGVSSQVYGLSQKAAHMQPQVKEAPNDATLAQKVQSEVFRDSALLRGQINVSAENGVIRLVGQVDRPEQINAIEAAVRRVPGVLSVENQLHLPGTPAPGTSPS